MALFSNITAHPHKIPEFALFDVLIKQSFVKQINWVNPLIWISLSHSVGEFDSVRQM